MKKKELKDLKSKDMEGLEKILVEKRKEISGKRIDARAGKEKNLKLVRNLRCEIAQILTVVREKEIIGKMEKIKADQKQ